MNKKELLSFTQAIELLLQGKKVRRPTFEVGKYLQEIGPKNFFMHSKSAVTTPAYKFSCEDVLAEDWEEVITIPEVVCIISVKCPICGHVINLYDSDEYDILNCVCGIQYKPVKPEMR